jgi:hypothetical protein
MSIIDIPNNKVLEVKERIILEIRYYDEADNIILASNKAARIEVNIKNSIYLKSMTEYLLDKNPFGQGNRAEITTDAQEVTDNVYTTIIEKDEYDSLSEILLKQLKTEVKSLHLKAELPTDIVINENVINHILSNFESIYINLSGMTNWITIPQISTRIKELTIESGQIYVTQSIISCSSSFNMKSCILQSKPGIKNRPSLLVNVGEKATLHDIKIADRLYIGISGSEVKRFDKWSLTNVVISDVVIGFKDIDRNDKVHNGMYDSLLTVAEINEVNISGIKSLNDIPYYSFLSIKNVNSINLSMITRNSIEHQALSPTIKLANYIKCNIFQIDYAGINNTSEKNSFIRLLKIKINSSLAISNAKLIKMPLLNLAGINCQKLSITTSTFIDNDVIINMDSSYIDEFGLNTVSIKNGKINIKAATLCINSATNINTKEDISLVIKENGNIFDSIVKSMNNINIKLSSDASLNINKTALDAIKDINIETEYNGEDELASSVILYNSNITATKMILNHFKTLNFNDLQWFQKSTNIMNCTYCSLKNISINPTVTIPITIDMNNVEIRPSNINIFNPLNHVLTLDKCTGNLHLAYLDDKNDSSKFMLNLINSNAIITFDAVSDRKVYLNSKESLGSLVFSESETMSIIPDIESPDRQHFERIAENKKDIKKVLYGNLISPV